ncbi:uncharacterized protein BDV17DRAFT_297495 [Aspergillus undulatus]|uniref:uncharacterized protein n=1 Tax=Aspergillus undulatus TaxID=1810928 RepID=UPI003CCDFA29
MMAAAVGLSRAAIYANAARANSVQFCGGGRFNSLRWILPPGIYPPGPPPPDILGPPPDPKWTVINPPLPPWPEITVGRDNQLTYSDKPPCETESAELCSTTITHSETLVGTTTSTVTATSSYCATIYGCSPTDWESSTTTSATACPLPTTPSDGTFEPPPIGCPAPAIVYPRDPENVGSIPSLLQGYDDYVEVGPTTERWVAFYWVPMLGQDTMDALRRSPDVSYAYYYEERNYNTGFPFTRARKLQDSGLPSGPEAPVSAVAARQETDRFPRSPKHTVLGAFASVLAQGQYLARA